MITLVRRRQIKEIFQRLYSNVLSQAFDTLPIVQDKKPGS